MSLLVDWLFVYTHSLRRHTWVLMGPDLKTLFKPSFKKSYAGLFFYGNKSQEQIKVKGKRRERPRQLTTNQVEHFYYCQHLGQEKGKS